jgi:hypothetical protein
LTISARFSFSINFGGFALATSLALRAVKSLKVGEMSVDVDLMAVEMEAHT